MTAKWGDDMRVVGYSGEIATIRCDGVRHWDIENKTGKKTNIGKCDCGKTSKY